MKYFIIIIIIRLSLCMSACNNGYSIIPEEILRRAECACKDNGGIASIQIKASDSYNMSRFNFRCAGGLETGWVMYNGDWGPDHPFHGCPIIPLER
jgi:hypothetical protein